MRDVIRTIVFCATVASAGAAWAAERIVRLEVNNIFCISCRYIIEQSLAAVPGVSEVQVLAAEGQALVTFDDAQADVAALTATTGDVGFPSRLLGEAE